MNRNANRLASKNHTDEADIRSRDHGGHSERTGVKRRNVLAARKGRRLDSQWEKRNRVE